jgi:uncharacterized membrane protein YdbT with pleckstrin-like domain
MTKRATSYVERALAPGETIEARAGLHWVLWLRAWLALIVLGVFLIGIYIFVRDVLFLSSTEVALTNRRLVFKTGIFHRQTSDLILSSIEAVKIDQSFWGRLLNYGRVSVHGTGDEVWRTPLISRPVEFRRAIAATRPGALTAALDEVRASSRS